MRLDSGTTKDVRFPYGPFALALYASDMPFSEEALPEDMLQQYAEQGERHLQGREQLEELHQRWLRLNHARMNGHLAEDQYEEALSELLPDIDFERLECCIAADLWRMLPH
jgi:hypothetical protein